MNEDRSFNEFLKAKLEEGVVAPALRRPAMRPIAWWRLVATIAVMAGALVWCRWDSPGERPGCGTERAIDFLEAYEGLQASSASSETFAERLLAWQDAPYDELAVD